MRWKKPFVAVLSTLVLAPAATFARVAVYASCPGTVTATDRYSGGGIHNAVDIAPGKCNHYAHKVGVDATWSWNVIIRTQGKVCNGNGSGNQNEVRHNRPNGYRYREFHFIKTGASEDKTCNRCKVGNVGGTGNASGPHSHQQYDKYGTNNSSWYTVKKGAKVTRETRIGWLP